MDERRDICIDCGRVLDPEAKDDFLEEVSWFESPGGAERTEPQRTGRLLCESCSGSEPG